MASATTKPTAVATGGDKPKADEQKPQKTARAKRQALRKQKMRRAQRAAALGELVGEMEAKEGRPLSRQQKKALSTKAYVQWQVRRKEPEKVARLEELVRKQQEEIRALKKALNLGKIPRLEPAAAAPVVDDEAMKEEREDPQGKVKERAVEKEAEPATGAEEPQGETISTPMEGVESTAVEEVVYPTLPSVESQEEDAAGASKPAAEAAPATEAPQKAAAEKPVPSVEHEEKPDAEAGPATETTQDAAADIPAPSIEEPVQPAGDKPVENPAVDDPVTEEPAPETTMTPKPKPKHKTRGSSEESNADTPRTLRRSPRKRTARRYIS